MAQGTIKDFEDEERIGSLLMEDRTEVAIDAVSVEGSGLRSLRIGQRVRFDLVDEAGRKVAFTLSDMFCVDRHRDGFNKLLDDRRIDILFANQAEVESLAGIPHLEDAVAAVKKRVETLVVTRSEDGALGTRGDERTDVEVARQQFDHALVVLEQDVLSRDPDVSRPVLDVGRHVHRLGEEKRDIELLVD